MGPKFGLLQIGSDGDNSRLIGHTVVSMIIEDVG